VLIGQHSAVDVLDINQLLKQIRNFLHLQRRWPNWIP